MKNYDSFPIDHIFICEGWHALNDMYPFFTALNKSRKLFFTDVLPENVLFGGKILPLSKLKRFKASGRRAVIYLSPRQHYNRYVQKGPLKFLKDFKIVRMFHGIVGPWAKIITSDDPFWDVIIAASRLDADFWKRTTRQQVEIMGWPKGESFVIENKLKPSSTNEILITSNWSVEKGDLRICDHLNQLENYQVTFALHPLLEQKDDSKRRFDPFLVERQLKKLERANVKTVSCNDGILPHMLNKSFLLSAVSSSALEWLLFNKPVIFLKKHPDLNFGPTMDFSKKLASQLDAAEKNLLYETMRVSLREKLMSHFDGRYANRFNELARQLEFEMVHESTIRTAI